MENRFDTRQSLSLIVEMIEQAKGDFRKGGGRYFLLWGYVIALACVVHFITFSVPGWSPVSSAVWPVTLAVGMAFTVVLVFRDRRSKVVRTYVGYMVSRIWMTFGIAVVLIYILLWNSNGLLIYPAISLVYTMTLFLSASAFKLRWMYVCVGVCVLCLGLYKVLGVGWQPMIMAAMLIAGNIVPGHILNIKGRGNV